MGKARKGANKTDTKTKRAKKRAKNQTMDEEKRKRREKQRIQTQRESFTKHQFEQALEEEAPREVRLAGRAIVLAHGAGGSSTHSSMKAWSQRLQPLCDQVVSFDFPRPLASQTMASLTAACAEAIGRARKAFNRRIILAGVGMGGRVALHLLSGVAGEGGEEIAPLPAELRECVVGAVALGHPLSGMQTHARTALCGLAADAPPLLLVCANNETNPLDLAELAELREACAAPTELHVFEGADPQLRLPSGTHMEREGTAALNTALEAFAGRTLGSAEQWSRKVVKKKKKKPADDTPEGPAPSALAKQAQQSLEQAQKCNALQQHLERKAHKQAAREAQLAEEEAAAAAKAAQRGQAEHVAAPPEVVVSGCGAAEVNGTYRPEGTRDGVPCYRQVGGQMTIERDSAEGQATQWCICVDFGFTTWAFADDPGPRPPASGWEVGEVCAAPPPTVQVPDAVAAAETEAASSAAELEAAKRGVGGAHGASVGSKPKKSASNRRRHKLKDAGKRGVMKSRRVKGRAGK